MHFILFNFLNNRIEKKILKIINYAKFKNIGFKIDRKILNRQYKVKPIQRQLYISNTTKTIKILQSTQKTTNKQKKLY